MQRSRLSARIQRRTFLRAVGLGIAVPLAAKMSRLAVAAPTAPPTRLFIYYMPHGMPLEHFEPAMMGSDIDLAASGLGVLSPLNPYKRSEERRVGKECR